MAPLLQRLSNKTSSPRNVPEPGQGLLTEDRGRARAQLGIRLVGRKPQNGLTTSRSSRAF
ncbi:hypothetical protein MMC31_005426, partial [Peltigera leucophlebia]|nr:hypothetical protein [Peltigera leucophlebia]